MEETKKVDNEKLNEIDQRKNNIKRIDDNIDTIINHQRVAEEGMKLASDGLQRIKKSFAVIEEGVTNPKSLQIYESLKQKEFSMSRRELEEFENNANIYKKQLNTLYEKLDTEKNELDKLYDTGHSDSKNKNDKKTS